MVISGIALSSEEINTVFIGLSREQLSRLKARKPITIHLSEAGFKGELAGVTILLQGGNDDESIAAELKALANKPITTDKTTTNQN